MKIEINDNNFFNYSKKELFKEIMRLNNELINEKNETAKLKNYINSIIDNSPTAIIVCDAPEGNISYINNAVWDFRGKTDAKMTGISVVEYVSTWKEYYPDGRQYKGEEMPLARSLLHGEIVKNEELIVELEDGTRKWTSAWSAPIKNNTGEIIGAMVLFYDVTEKKEVELEILEAKNKADLANKAKSIFLANMSHELRTPMNAILGYSQLMQRDASLSPKQYKYLDTINRSGELLLALINDVLEISKIEAGKTALDVVTFDLRTLLGDLEEMFRARTDAKGLQFEVMGMDEVPDYIEADENKLGRVLINLLGNAVKFTEEGGVTLRVSAKSIARGAECKDTEKKANQILSPNPNALCLTFEVEDTGIGIAEDELDDVFAYFEQTASGRAKKSGTGLGLAISRDYIRMMGGDITVTSQEGKGSTFGFETPVRESGEAYIKEKAVRQRRVIGLEPGQDIPRILVAEDMEESRTMLAKLLRTVGFQVREATDGKQAVKIFHEWQPDFIWMDIRMPVMDGLETTRHIKKTEAGQSTVVAALTAHALEEEKERILSAGCDDFVRKPFREYEIFDVMGKHLGLRYEYEDSRAEAVPAEPEVEISPEQLAALPADLRRQLHKATVELDRKGALALIGKIKTIDAHIAEGLEFFVRNLAFELLLDLLEKKEQSEQEDSHE